MSIPDEQPFGAGDILLGKYRVEKVLGRGGMGLVLAARHLTLDDRVAIKLLLPHCAQDAQLVERFLREARAAVRVGVRTWCASPMWARWRTAHRTW